MSDGHLCQGPVVHEGDYEISLYSKKNNSGIKLNAKGKVRLCDKCGWFFATPNEGVYSNASEEKENVRM